MSFKYLYLIENVNHDLICLLMITKITHSCWLTVRSWSTFKFFLEIKPFFDLSTFALKSEHIRFLQDFIAWPKCLETGTTKTEKSRDENNSDRKDVYLASATLPKGNAGMKINETNDSNVSLFTGVWKCSACEWTSSLDQCLSTVVHGATLGCTTKKGFTMVHHKLVTPNRFTNTSC